MHMNKFAIKSTLITRCGLDWSSIKTMYRLTLAHNYLPIFSSYKDIAIARASVKVYSEGKYYNHEIFDINVTKVQ